MTNGWTGGQYSLCRALLGIYLFAHFATLVPAAGEIFSNPGVLRADAGPFFRLFPNLLAISDSPAVVTSLLTVAAAASLCFAAGLYDRAAAIVMWFALVSLSGRNAFIANPSLSFGSLLLLWHACLPSSPYGSWSARSRIDPRGGWHLPPPLFAAAWAIMSVGYSYSGYTRLASGAATLALELVYAPLALIRRARPWIWLAMVGLLVGRMVLIGFTELSLGVLFLHLFTFDPQWVPSRWSERRDMIFYDGTCGLCHGVTRFVLSEDRPGTAFTFAPLQGDTFAAMIATNDRSALPDSVIVRTETGEWLTRSEAVIYTLQRLGGLWRVLAVALPVVPRTLRNRAYDFVASVRYRFFGRAQSACPILPPDLRSRFQN